MDASSSSSYFQTRVTSLCSSVVVSLSLVSWCLFHNTWILLWILYSHTCVSSLVTWQETADSKFAVKCHMKRPIIHYLESHDNT